jgi:hypothetical protein
MRFGSGLRYNGVIVCDFTSGSPEENAWMSSESMTSPGPDSAASTPVPINITASGLAGLKRYEQEIATYLRELPRLIQEGQSGRHALIKGEEILSIWDTQGDAIQAGCERFGLEPIFVKTIDPRDPQRFALLQKELLSRKDVPCPP